MKNNKGFIFGPVIALAIVKWSFVFITVSCLWHVPAWSKAKSEGKTAEYQAQKMWPQEQIERLTGNVSINPVSLPVTSGNRGNFINGNML